MVPDHSLEGACISPALLVLMQPSQEDDARLAIDIRDYEVWTALLNVGGRQGLGGDHGVLLYVHPDLVIGVARLLGSDSLASGAKPVTFWELRKNVSEHARTYSFLPIAIPESAEVLLLDIDIRRPTLRDAISCKAVINVLWKFGDRVIVAETPSV